MYNREHVFPAEISKAAFKKPNSNKIKFHSPINLPAQLYCATWCFFAHFRRAEWSLMEGVCVGASFTSTDLIDLCAWGGCRQRCMQGLILAGPALRRKSWAVCPNTNLANLSQSHPITLQCLCLSSWVWLILKTYILHIAYHTSFQSELCYCAISTLLCITTWSDAAPLLYNMSTYTQMYMIYN